MTVFRFHFFFHTVLSFLYCQYSSSFRRLPLLKYLGVGEAKFRGSGRGVYSLPFHYPYFFSGVGLAASPSTFFKGVVIASYTHSFFRVVGEAITEAVPAQFSGRGSYRRPPARYSGRGGTENRDRGVEEVEDVGCNFLSLPLPLNICFPYPSISKLRGREGRRGRRRNELL